ncbi:MAG: hypothetical protein GIW97_09420 [Candidatus Eremiobacteraeota bacterium]|nr:hypothetical protein [Candidatus Eremiobacteraeota bacterium]
MRHRRILLGIAIWSFLMFALHVTATARCSTTEVEHDRQKGPWLIRAGEGPAPSVAERMRFSVTNTYLLRYLNHYRDYRTAMADGYDAHLDPRKVSIYNKGSLVSFHYAGYPAILNLSRPSMLFYREMNGRLELTGGGYMLLARKEADLFETLPPALVKWHRLQYACTAPPSALFEATFLLRGKPLDWNWPGIDKYDLDASLQTWPWTEGRLRRNGVDAFPLPKTVP